MIALNNFKNNKVFLNIIIINSRIIICDVKVYCIPQKDNKYNSTPQ